MAIIGGVGKSSARAALLRALGGDGGNSDIFSNGNRNDELGIPLALGELGTALAVADNTADEHHHDECDHAELQRVRQ